MNVERVAKVFSALSSPARVRIVLELLRDPKCHLDVARCVSLDVSTVWRHAKRLEEAGIVVTRREGRKVIAYPVRPDLLSKLLELANELSGQAVPSPPLRSSRARGRRRRT